MLVSSFQLNFIRALHRLLFLLLCMILIAGCKGLDMYAGSPYKDLYSLKEGVILHLPTGVEVSKAQMMDLLKSARIIYVGESHDNIHAHHVQMEILRSMDKAFPGGLAVGMEMLRRPAQEAADRWIQGTLDERSLFKEWLSNWGNDYRYYKPILAYLRERKIPLVALNAPKEWISRAREGPFKELPDKDSLPEMDRPDPFHKDYARAIFEAHGHGSRDFETFYRVFLLWDETMAESMVNFLMSPAGQDKRMLVFAGANHVQYGFGIPRRVFRRLPLPYQIVLPFAFNIPPEKKDKVMEVDLPEIPLPLADLIWAVQYEDLEAERVYLGVKVEDSEQGVRVLKVLEGSVAKKAGINGGDVILSMDNEKIISSSDLEYILDQKRPGDSVEIQVSQEGKELRLRIQF